MDWFQLHEEKVNIASLHNEKFFLKKTGYQVHFLIMYVFSFSFHLYFRQSGKNPVTVVCIMYECFASLWDQSFNPYFKLWILIFISSSGYPKPEQMNCSIIKMICSPDPLCSLKWCNLNHFNLKAERSQKLQWVYDTARHQRKYIAVEGISAYRRHNIIYLMNDTDIKSV